MYNVYSPLSSQNRNNNCDHNDHHDQCSDLFPNDKRTNINRTIIGNTKAAVSVMAVTNNVLIRTNVTII